MQSKSAKLRDVSFRKKRIRISGKPQGKKQRELKSAAFKSEKLQEQHKQTAITNEQEREQGLAARRKDSTCTTRHGPGSNTKQIDMIN